MLQRRHATGPPPEPAIATSLGRLLRKKGIPIIDVSAARFLPDIPYVETDDAAIAAEHFLERDFRHFAFLGDARFRWSENRCDAFVAALESRGFTVDVFEKSSPGRKRRLGRPVKHAAGEVVDDTADVEAWLASLPKPVAVFTCYDIRGRQALEACRRAGLAVPDQVAVLGVDDEIVAAAVRCIRENACRGIKVSDVVKQVSTSRRVLESRFTRLLGRTPHEEIARVHFRRVEQLLREIDLPLSAIAERAGFRHPEYMTVAFTRRHGMPPSHRRRKRT